MAIWLEKDEKEGGVSGWRTSGMKTVTGPPEDFLTNLTLRECNCAHS